MKRISALTMRKQFGKYLDLVAQKKEPVLISRANQPMVVMIPLEEYEEYERVIGERAQRQEAGRRMDELRESIRKRIGRVDVVATIRKMRNSR